MLTKTLEDKNEMVDPGSHWSQAQYRETRLLARISFDQNEIKAQKRTNLIVLFCSLHFGAFEQLFFSPPLGNCWLVLQKILMTRVRHPDKDFRKSFPALFKAIVVTHMRA